MKKLLFIIMLAISCSPRVPDNQNITNISNLVEKSVTELKIYYTPQFIYRVIAGRNENGGYLYVEEYTREVEVESNGVKTAKLIDLSKVIGGDKLKLSDGWYLKDFQTSKKGLIFKNVKIIGSLIESQNCEIILIQKEPQVQCVVSL